jgi:hypothetical protein
MPCMRSGVGIIPVSGVTSVFVPYGEVEVDAPPCRVLVHCLLEYEIGLECLPAQDERTVRVEP